MSTVGPDAQIIFIFDRDEHGAGWVEAEVNYHNGTLTPENDRWTGTLSRDQYDDLSAKAAISQPALDTESNTIMGNWYSTKPAGFKVAWRHALNDSRWPKP